MVKKIIIKQYKLYWLDSLINSIPMFIGLMIFILLLFTGAKAIINQFSNSEFYEIMLIVWIILCMKFTKLVPPPVTTWSVKKEVQDESTN